MRRSLDSKAMIGFRLIGLLAVALAALVAVGCGSADEKISSGTARNLDGDLTTLQGQIDAIDCIGADETLNAINMEADTVSGDVGNGLDQLLVRLGKLYDEICADFVEPTTVTSSTTSSSTSTTSDTTDTSTSTSTETSTTTDSSSTSTTDSTSTDTTPPGGGGGTGGTAPGGNKRGGS